MERLRAKYASMEKKANKKRPTKSGMSYRLSPQAELTREIGDHISWTARKRGEIHRAVD